jgi:hypothetical protein
MTFPGDTSPEMHNNELSSNDVDRLLSSPAEFSAGAALDDAFAELRGASQQLSAPAVSGALAEFVGVNLAPTPAPVIDADEPATSVAPMAPDPVHNVRRKPLIGQLAAFFGTLGGKVCVGTTVAAASFGGAAATGVVDVPFVDDEPAAVQTVDIEDPNALAFVDDAVPEAPAPEPEAVEAEDVEEPDKAVEEPELGDLERKELEEFDSDADEDHEDEKDEEAEEDVEEVENEEKPEEIAPAEDETDKDTDKDDADSAAKDESSDKDHDNNEDGKGDQEDEGSEKTEAEEELQELIGALDEELHVNKDLVRAEARALIEPLEADRKELVEALEAETESIVNEWAPTIEQLELDLEDAEGEEAREEAEVALDDARAEREEAIAAAELEAQPALDEIDESLETIELERDAELNRLIAEFLAAVAELEGDD